MNLKQFKERLLETYIRYGYAKSKGVIEAFKRVPREEFIHPNQRIQAYDDQPLPIRLNRG